MEDREKRAADQRIELLVSNLLRMGVLLAAVVVLAGGMAYLIGHGGDVRNYHAFRVESHTLRSVPLIVRSALSLQSEAIIQLGLLLLIATPVARVALAAMAFALARDALYTAVGILVLLILLASLMGYL